MLTKSCNFFKTVNSPLESFLGGILSVAHLNFLKYFWYGFPENNQSLWCGSFMATTLAIGGFKVILDPLYDKVVKTREDHKVWMEKLQALEHKLASDEQLFAAEKGKFELLASIDNINKSLMPKEIAQQILTSAIQKTSSKTDIFEIYSPEPQDKNSLKSLPLPETTSNWEKAGIFFNGIYAAFGATAAPIVDGLLATSIYLPELAKDEDNINLTTDIIKYTLMSLAAIYALKACFFTWTGEYQKSQEELARKKEMNELCSTCNGHLENIQKHITELNEIKQKLFKPIKSTSSNAWCAQFRTVKPQEKDGDENTPLLDQQDTSINSSLV